jgi:DNA-binding IclR family transcriptional regulator
MTGEGLRAAEKALVLLEAFRADHGVPAGVAELSRRTGLPKSTTYRLLRLLERFRLVERWAGRYVLSDRLMELGAGACRARLDALQVVMQPWMQDLYEQTRAIVRLEVLCGRFTVRVALLCGHHSAGLAIGLGDKVPAVLSPAGKIILAHSSTETCDRVVSSGAASELGSPAALSRFYAELAQARRQGFLSASERFGDDVLTVAAPLFDHRHDAVAALALTGLFTSSRLPALASSIRATAVAASAAATEALGNGGATATPCRSVG